MFNKFLSEIYSETNFEKSLIFDFITNKKNEKLLIIKDLTEVIPFLKKFVFQTFINKNQLKTFFNHVMKMSIKLNYQIYDEKYFKILNTLEKKFDFLKHKFDKDKILKSKERMVLVDLFRFYYPQYNQIKSEIIEFDKKNGSLVGLINYYNSKVKHQIFENYDIKINYLF
jgi:hypothetical protein